MSQPTWIGRALGGRYRIEELLGQGGMSAVYKATDPNLRRVVAVKLIHTHLSSNPDFVRRFEEEAAAVAQLRHPHIVQVYDFNHDGDVYYIVFEFVPGETLQDRLKRLSANGRLLPINETIQIAASIGDALDYAHKRGLVHRDVKPANVMLNVHNEAILTDFGIVKITGGTQHTATGAVLGTAQYMSPEQIRGTTIDARSDIYSLGVVLFEMLGGRPPFAADSAMSLMMMHVTDPVPDLRAIRPETPPDLTAVVEKALAKNSEARYQSAAAFIGDLRRVQAGQPPLAITPPRPATDATMLETAVPGATLPASAHTVVEPFSTPEPAPFTPSRMPQAKQAASNGRRNMLAIGGVIGLVVIIAAVLAFSGLFGGENGAEPPATPQGIAETAATLPAADAPPPTTTLAPTATIAPTTTPDATATYVAELQAQEAEMAMTQAAASPTPEPTPTMTPEPLPTAPTGPYVRINNITVNQSSAYVVEYETFGYTEQLPGVHVHFFFNTVAPENAGVPGSGPWILYGGPRPFTGYTTNDRPGAATQMCALVANANHSVQLNTGNCYNLP